MPIYLIINHLQQVKIPTLSEIILSPLKNDLEEALKKCKKPSDTAKIVKKFAYANRKMITVEQIFISNSLSHKQINNAAVIIDTDSKKFIKENYKVNIDEYLNRYDSDIKQLFNQKSRK